MDTILMRRTCAVILMIMMGITAASPAEQEASSQVAFIAAQPASHQASSQISPNSFQPRADLAGWDLRDMDLSGMNLSQSTLAGADLRAQISATAISKRRTHAPATFPWRR